MWQPLAHLLALLLAGALTACAAPPPAAAPLESQLQATRWRLQTATNGQGERIAALFPSTERHFILEFSAGRLGVGGGCNAMGGSYQLHAGQLQTGPLMATRKGCEAPLALADAAITALLAQAWQVQLENGTPRILRLRSTKGEALVWSRLPEP